MKQIFIGKLKKIYFTFETISTGKEIIQHIFNTLPIFLSAKCMVEIDKLEMYLYEAKKIYDDANKFFERGYSEENLGKKHSQKMDCVLERLLEYRKIINNIFGNLRLNLSVSLTASQTIFINKIDAIAKDWQFMLSALNEFVYEIDQEAEMKNEKIDQFKKDLEKLSFKIEDLWHLFIADFSLSNKVAQNKLRVYFKQLKNDLPKNIYQRYCQHIKTIKEKTIITGGGIELQLHQYPLLIILIMRKFLKAERIEPTLHQMADLFDLYARHLQRDRITRIKGFFGTEHYKQALKVQEDAYLLIQWYDKFFNDWQRIKIKYEISVSASTDTKLSYLNRLHLFWQKLQYAHELKKLIYSEKNLFYRAFRAIDKKYRETMVAIELTKGLLLRRNIADLKPRNLIKEIEQKNCQLNEEILKLESQFKDYNFTVGIFSSVSWLFSESPYYRWSDIFLATTDRKIAVNVELSGNDLTIGTNVLASSIFAVDCFTCRRFGISFTMLTNISMSIQKIIAVISNNFKIGKSKTIQSIVNLEVTWGLGAMIVFNCFKLGISVNGIIYCTASYAFASLGRTILRYIVDAMMEKDDLLQFYENLSTKEMIIGNIGWYAGNLACRYIYPYAAQKTTTLFLFFKKLPSVEEMINDRELCHTYEQQCIKAAKQLLKLKGEDDLTRDMIRKAFHKQALRWHPDARARSCNKPENGNSYEQRYIAIVKAKEILSEFVEKEGERVENYYKP